MTVFTIVDCETNGLDANRHSLLEIAVAVVDSDLNLLGEPWESVIAYSPEELRFLQMQAIPYVGNMHMVNGLWAEIRDGGGKPLEVVDAELTEYLARFSAPRESSVAGNSNRLDMNFMDVHLPSVAGHLNYRMIDVSTIAQLAEVWSGIPPMVKQGGHRALGDVLECLAELRYYRGVFDNDRYIPITRPVKGDRYAGPDGKGL